MWMSIFVLSTIAFFTCFFYMVFKSVFSKKIHMNNRIHSLITTKEEQNKKEPVTSNFKEQFEKMKDAYEKRIPEAKKKEIKKKIEDAGKPFGLTTIQFMMFRLFFSVGISSFIFLLFLSQSSEWGKVSVLVIVIFIFAYSYPMIYLNAKKKQRTEEIEKMMPDFFDMVNVTIGAGMGLDAALNKVSKQMDGALSQEFLYVLDEMKLGKSKKEAFTALRDRVPSEQLQSVLNSLLQADQMGIGITKTLKAQTTRIREKRRQQAKEKAMKAPVKMMVPMILFIFPTLFVVLLGPVVIQLFTGWN